MKKLFMVIIFSIMPHVSAMERPQPMDIGLGDIVLVGLRSAEGKEHWIPARAAIRSPYIALLLGRGEVPGFKSREAQEKEIIITLNQISSAALELLIPLLERLDDLEHRNEVADPQNRIYVPRWFQPIVNKQLRSVEAEDLARLYQAADFLSVPFVINAVAAVLAERMAPEIDDAFWANLNNNQRLALIKQNAANLGIYVNQEYILKHVTFRKGGIMREYSIADYLEAHPAVYGAQEFFEVRCGLREPPFIEEGNVKLDAKELTSLFGIDRLPHKDMIKILNLHDNWFFDFSLDPQCPENPFAGFRLLNGVYLAHNHIIRLPENIFRGGTMALISLADNQLPSLPQGIFEGLPNLRVLNLANNSLSHLPEHLFSTVRPLVRLLIFGNPLTEHDRENIERVLPRTVIRFVNIRRER